MKRNLELDVPMQHISWTPWCRISDLDYLVFFKCAFFWRNFSNAKGNSVAQRKMLNLSTKKLTYANINCTREKKIVAPQVFLWQNDASAWSYLEQPTCAYGIYKLSSVHWNLFAWQLCYCHGYTQVGISTTADHITTSTFCETEHKILRATHFLYFHRQGIYWAR